MFLHLASCETLLRSPPRYSPLITSRARRLVQVLSPERVHHLLDLLPAGLSNRKHNDDPASLGTRVLLELASTKALGMRGPLLQEVLGNDILGAPNLPVDKSSVDVWWSFLEEASKLEILLLLEILAVGVNDSSKQFKDSFVLVFEHVLLCIQHLLDINKRSVGPHQHLADIEVRAPGFDGV